MRISPIILFSVDFIIYAIFDEDQVRIYPHVFLSNVVHVYYFTLIIRIIKTTCFNNPILMAELEGKLS